MAYLHPTSLPESEAAGARRERDVLALLECGLREGYDIFHGVEWSSYWYDRQQIGEIDIAVVTPDAALVLIEVKAGALAEVEGRLSKRYGSGTKDVGAQVRRQHAAIVGRLADFQAFRVSVESFLVLPDHRCLSDSVGYVRERIVDAVDLPNLCERIAGVVPRTAADAAQRQALIGFLSNAFQVVPDVSTRIGNVQRLSRSLAAGLATWVPQMRHVGGVYQVQATAGAGKTQLALKLLTDAASRGAPAAYVCFNRALADHLQQQATVGVEVCTLDQLCVAEARRAGVNIDFDSANVFARLRQRMVASPASPRWQLLVVDEMQDLAPEAVLALHRFVRPGGALYLLGDAQQALQPTHARPRHDWPDAVQIHCQDNFRSPRRVVETINLLRLCDQPVQARSGHAGDMPAFVSYDAADAAAGLQVLGQCVQSLLDEGVAAGDIVLLSYLGRERSQLLAQAQLAGLPLRKATGRYNARGEAEWTEGALLADTLYRFKGQSAPVVVLCEVDFAALDDAARARLFVAFTRAQYRLVCVLSTRAGAALFTAAEAG